MLPSIEKGFCLAVFCFSFLSSNGFVKAQILPGNVVDTQYGQILGNRRLLNGQLYEEYLSIPFAAPPVGDLRWRKPQPVEPWGDILNGTVNSIHCTQLISILYPLIGMGREDGEDCLYLNVWVPGGVNLIEEPLPVVVFIYGGGFSFGTTEMYPVNGLAVGGNVIAVNFNYRVNVLGWLSTEDSALPGNYGLWDTQAALQWVQDNIASFKGDPDRVTIFGQSAGGAIVSHAVISEQTNTLFHSASAISGAASATGFGTSRPSTSLRKAVNLATIMNCTFTNTEEIVSCLREKDPHDLVFWGNMAGGSSVPVVDGDFVVRLPEESFEMGEGSHINFMTGSCYHDSASFMIGNPIGLPALGDRLSVARTNESLYQSYQNRFSGTLNQDEMVRSVFDMYPEMDTSDNLTRSLEAAKCQTEQMFAAWSNWEAVRHANADGTGKTFSYMFRYRQSFLTGYPEWINGTHLDDLYSILGTPFMQTYRLLVFQLPYDELDTEVMERMMNYYSNFAYTGDPNIGPNPTVTDWEEFDPIEQNFLRQSPTFQTGSYYEDNTVDRYRYWTDLYPTLPQYPPPEGLPSLDDIPRITEEEIEENIEKLREYLYETIEDEGILAELEETIQEFIENRKYGRF